MRDRNPGEWIRAKDRQCRCFQRPGEGPFQYEPGENYFCFKGMIDPFGRQHSNRYALLLWPFSVDPAQEQNLLDHLHQEEIEQGHISDPYRIRFKLGLLTQAMTADAWRAVHGWLERNMIQDIDHRLFGEFKTPQEWTQRERQLLGKYAKHKWTHLQGLAPTRWMNLHKDAGTLEMLHRADKLFVTQRPPVIASRRDEGATAQVRSMSKERKDIE